MANELDKFANDEINEAEAQVELDEFKADGENSEVADPVTKGSNKRPADKTASFTAPAPGNAKAKNGTEVSSKNGLTVEKGKAPARKGDKPGSDKPVTPSVSTPGQGSVREDINAIFGDEDLSEELREKAETVFEAAVNVRVSEYSNELSEAFDLQLAEAKEVMQEEMSEKVDNYLNYVAEEWMKENQVAIESSLKVEIAESFMDGLKGLMEAHNIQLPEDADSDVLTNMTSQVEELEAKLEEETVAKIEISNQLQVAEQNLIFTESTKDLAETKIEKLRALSEGLDYDNAEDYSAKLNMLKESYFGKKPAVVSSMDDDPIDLDEETQPRLKGGMANYAAAISRTARK
tara:strand:+ start:2646 stop:3689 length:1044 start_codon:yes stop_codon:yes gene_type:complete